ncbi:MAG: YlmH/Sll1252 family protein [Fusobacteria bacterium]|nr:YlmH/Sll1252 family protein [Fusobacteriota bacterium]
MIKHRKQDEIGHRDILGALMNLGLERNTIGDIVAFRGKGKVKLMADLGMTKKNRFKLLVGIYN